METFDPHALLKRCLPFLQELAGTTGGAAPKNAKLEQLIVHVESACYEHERESKAATAFERWLHSLSADTAMSGAHLYNAMARKALGALQVTPPDRENRHVYAAWHEASRTDRLEALELLRRLQKAAELARGYGNSNGQNAGLEFQRATLNAEPQEGDLWIYEGGRAMRVIATRPGFEDTLRETFPPLRQPAPLPGQLEQEEAPSSRREEQVADVRLDSREQTLSLETLRHVIQQRGMRLAQRIALWGR